LRRKGDENNGENSTDINGPETAPSPSRLSSMKSNISSQSSPNRWGPQRHHHHKRDSPIRSGVGHEECHQSRNMAPSTISNAEEEEAKQHLIDQKEADKLKLEGNAYMSTKEYKNAIDAYTAAIRLNPAGSSSHVYFSNRAAALCYLERYEEAEMDSERSLALRPEYSKAHARLGLSRFFLGDYEGSVEAYTAALRLDPTNAASRSYLAKACKKLDEMRTSMVEVDGADDINDDSAVVKNNAAGLQINDATNDASDGDVSMTARSPPMSSSAPPSSRVVAVKTAATAIAMDNSSDSLPKPTLDDFIAEMERISELLKEEEIDCDNLSRSSQDVGGEAGDAIDSLLNDPHMMEIIDSLYLDEKSLNNVKSRMNDPSVVDALMEARQVSLTESEI